MSIDLQQRLNIHKQFWRGHACDCLPVSFRIGDYFFADKFAAANELLVPGKVIKPAMIKPERFIEGYEKMFKDTVNIGQSGFFTAEPYVGIPWLEAILGCQIQASEKSFVSEPRKDALGKLLMNFDLDNNEWFLKYLEFTKTLVQYSNGRYPVGQPIMRGLSDAFGALTGQEQMIFHLFDYPEESRCLIAGIADIFKEVIRRQFELIPDFHGGYAMGFYHIWTPGKCIWFQEDLSSILSPELFAEFIQEEWQDVCRSYKYNAIHLHPSAFHNLDLILKIDSLQAVEINKDEEGPSLKDLLPVFRQVLREGKRLILWGNLTEDEITLIMKNFGKESVFLNIVAKDINTAKKLLSIVEGVSLS